jgi:hypothetical protein
VVGMRRGGEQRDWIGREANRLVAVVAVLCLGWGGKCVIVMGYYVCYAATGGTPFSLPVSGIEAAVAHQDGRLGGWPVTGREEDGGWEGHVRP